MKKTVLWMSVLLIVETVLLAILCITGANMRGIQEEFDRHVETASADWCEEKEKWASSNGQYRERETLFQSIYSSPVDLCCLGDSITQKLEWQDAYPNLRVANRGIGSDTTEGMLARLDSVVKLKPATISLMAGINDLSIERAPAEITETYRTLLDALAQSLPDTRVIVSSILPVSASHPISAADILETNTLLQALCEEKGTTSLDLFGDFADQENHLKQEYAMDSVHLTPAGYALWLAQLDRALDVPFADH